MIKEPETKGTSQVWERRKYAPAMPGEHSAHQPNTSIKVSEGSATGNLGKKLQSGALSSMSTNLTGSILNIPRNSNKGNSRLFSPRSIFAPTPAVWAGGSLGPGGAYRLVCGGVSAKEKMGNHPDRARVRRMKNELETKGASLVWDRRPHGPAVYGEHGTRQPNASIGGSEGSATGNIVGNLQSGALGAMGTNQAGSKISITNTSAKGNLRLLSLKLTFRARSRLALTRKPYIRRIVKPRHRQEGVKP